MVRRRKRRGRRKKSSTTRKKMTTWQHSERHSFGLLPPNRCRFPFHDRFHPHSYSRHPHSHSRHSDSWHDMRAPCPRRPLPLALSPHLACFAHPTQRTTRAARKTKMKTKMKTKRICLCLPCEARRSPRRRAHRDVCCCWCRFPGRRPPSFPRWKRARSRQPWRRGSEP